MPPWKDACAPSDLFPGRDGLAYPKLKLPGGRDVPELSVGRERAANRTTGKPNF